MLQIALQETKKYWANGWHLLLFALALIYIIICVKEKNTKKTFLWYSGLFAAIFICPLTAKIIIKFIGASVYWRMLWILPTSIIMAFAFTHLYEKINEKWIKTVVALAITLAVALGGAWMYTNREFVTAPNWYKVSSAVPGICEEIQNDAKEQGLEPKAVVVNSLLTEIRQYDAGIKLLYGRNAERGSISSRRRRVYKQMQREIPWYKQFSKQLKSFNCNYVVWTGSEKSFAGFEKNGFRLVGQVEQYKIYFIDSE